MAQIFARQMMIVAVLALALCGCDRAANPATRERASRPAPKKLICESQGVPSGWTIVQRLASWSPCGSEGARWIEQTGAAEMRVCEAQPVPGGYAIVQVIVSSICGTVMGSPGHVEFRNGWVIRKTGAKTMTICDFRQEGLSIPAGYRLLSVIPLSICGSRYVGNNQWQPRDGLYLGK